MKPVKFNETNVTYAEDQPPYLPLPAHKVGNREGEVITCWKMTPGERIKVLFFGVIWVRQLTFYKPLQPISMEINPPFKENKANVITRWICFFIWNHLAGGKSPFYQSSTLKRFKAPVAPNAGDWFGLKLKLWNVAQNYLVKIGELTYTPTLTEKF